LNPYRELLKNVLKASYLLTDKEAERLMGIIEHGVRDISDATFIKYYIPGARFWRLAFPTILVATLKEFKEILEEALKREGR